MHGVGTVRRIMRQLCRQSRVYEILDDFQQIRLVDAQHLSEFLMRPHEVARADRLRSEVIEAVNNTSRGNAEHGEQMLCLEFFEMRMKRGSKDAIKRQNLSNKEDFESAVDDLNQAQREVWNQNPE